MFVADYDTIKPRIIIIQLYPLVVSCPWEIKGKRWLVRNCDQYRDVKERVCDETETQPPGEATHKEHVCSSTGARGRSHNQIGQLECGLEILIG